MLSSIHPLGERGRHNRWGITVTSYTVGAMASGAAVGALLGLLGSYVFGAVDPRVSLSIMGAVAIASGTLDLSRVSPPGPTRQVNEHWIGHYRGWVYGGAFGAQLGLGVVTFVVTWTVYATLISELILARPLAGAFVGAVFGLGRSLALLLAGIVGRPSELTAFHRLMDRLGAPVMRLSGYTVFGVGLVAITGALL